MATSGPGRLRGGDGADRIEGGDGADVIFGFDGGTTDPRVGRIVVERVGGGLDGAVFAGAAPGRPDELFVVRKDVGRIEILDPETGERTTFLDIPDGQLATGGEQGLLGLAFHPDYADNGRCFVHLVNAAGDIEIREYRRSAGDPDRADPEGRTLLTVPHPGFANHNGGALAFGPNDGRLYIALGDGGGANDPPGNAQNLAVLLGKILRIDVDRDDFPGDPARNYAVPERNPFVGAPGADEIWAYGLRNPWRISFDADGALYIADVGQSAREEIDVQPAGSRGGENYGWDLAEGTVGSPPPGAVAPVFEYGRELGAAVTGGYVYDGPEASMRDAYVFADFVSGNLWTLPSAGGGAEATLRTTQLTGAPLAQIASFGLDGRGSLYAVSLEGDVLRLRMTDHAGDLGDRLRGGDGADRLYGGPGDDRLLGNPGGDRLRGGFGDDTLRGGDGRDRLQGHAGADRLIGGDGFDRLRGGGGDDAFTLSGSEPEQADRIVDFAPGIDRILLDRDDFDTIGGALSRDEFRLGRRALDGDDRVLYDADAGRLFYDADGSGAAPRALMARLDDGLDLDAGDFLLF